MKQVVIFLWGITFICDAALPMLPTGWRVHDVNRPQPDTVQPGKTFREAPSDAIVLFDGTSVDAWWSAKGDISWSQHTRQSLHSWAKPDQKKLRKLTAPAKQ